MKLRSELREFIKWQIEKELVDYMTVDYEMAERYLEQKNRGQELPIHDISKRSELLMFMEFAINLPEIPEHSTKELIVDKYLDQ